MYTLTTHVNAPFNDVVKITRDALAEQGFGVLTEIDVRATMKARLDADLEPFLILGACNPSLAYQALSAERSIGVLLPCNVVIRQDGEQVLVEAIDPMGMLGVVEDGAVRQVAADAAERLSNALESVH